MRSFRPARGFTLAELMIVVVIMGILAAMGSQAFITQMSRSKTTEGLSVARSISGAQEAFRAHNKVYFDVSVSGAFYPAGNPGWDTTNTFRGQMTFWNQEPHADYDRWVQLAPSIPKLITFRYRTRAGLPGTGPPALHADAAALTWPTTQLDWYTVEALGDVDGDGDQNLIVMTSFSGAAFQSNYGE